MRQSKTRIFNIAKSPIDTRDRVYRASDTEIKQEIDLRQWDTPIEDQGSLGSCASHALTSSYELMLKKDRPADLKELSRLFVYYNTRMLEESISEDFGVVYLRNALKASNTYGLCDETLWPYNIEKFKDKPTPNCYDDGIKRKIVNYKSLTTQEDIIDALNQNKPVLIGFTIYDGFMYVNSKKPIIPMPADTDIQMGGHAVSIVGYSLPYRQFLIKNSFGLDWGDKGYGWMPFDYFNAYVFDRWVFDISIDEGIVQL